MELFKHDVVYYVTLIYECKIEYILNWIIFIQESNILFQKL